MMVTQELRRKNVSQAVVAKALGISEKTMTNKLNGSSEFTINEAMNLAQNFLPEFTLEYLFGNQTILDHTES